MALLNDIQTALNARLQLLDLEVAWEGVPYRPTTGVPYVAAKVASRQAVAQGIGPFVPRLWTGNYSLLVTHPAGEGLAPAYEQADALLAQFPRGLVLSTGAARLTIERGSIAPAYPAADWLHVPVSLDWFLIEFPPG